MFLVGTTTIVLLCGLQVRPAYGAIDATPQAPILVFDATRVSPGDKASLRTSSTGKRIKGEDLTGPKRYLKVYLVPRTLRPAAKVPSDPRIHYIGSIAVDQRLRGVLNFTVPPVTARTYTVAVWCAHCRPQFEVQAPVRSPRGLLYVRAFSHTSTDCASTVPNLSRPPGETSKSGYHGNGAVWVVLPFDGVLDPDDGQILEDGSFWIKMTWWAVGTVGNLAVRFERLDAPSRLRSADVVAGWPSSNFRGSGSWASRMHFPSEGCWKVVGVIKDVRLSFIVHVRLSE